MSSPVTKILLVEDNPADERLLREALAEMGDIHFEIARCATLAQTLEFLAQNTPHVILSDLGLADSQGLETVRRIREAAPGVPIVVLTINDESVGTEALREGAQDYLPKGQIDGRLLWRALRYAMERHRLHQLEEQLLQAQKMEAIGQLAGGMAHDFNNLLTIIGGRNEILLEHLDAHSPLRKDALQVKQAVDRGAVLISQLLGFSRKQMVRPRLMDLNAIVSALGKMLPPLLGEQVDLLVTPAASPCVVKADAVQIQQIVMNLAVNARDAMPHGGHLRIETSLVEPGDVSFQQSVGIPARTYAVLMVSDDGSGMDSGTKKRIFEPFFTTKGLGRGTGLGLSTVYGIVQQSGGHIVVDSSLGHGTAFRIYWPAIEGTIPEPEVPKAPPSSHASGSETILLVEDEPCLRGMVRDFLRLRGYCLLEAENGLEALNICGRHKEPIHLVLTDMIMPNMTGRDLANRIAKILPDTRILYMSGYIGQDVTEDGSSIQSISLITKPFTLKALGGMVREVLDMAPHQKV